MTPEPGEPGSDTWRGDDWKTGGAATWVTGNYDPETNLVFWGVGNGYPWVALSRPGDNLYTASTVAIDATTGAIKGHFQYTPNESWDWDEVSPPILIDFRRGGRTIKGLVNFGRNGYLYFLERTSNAIKFVEGKPYVKQNVFKPRSEARSPYIDRTQTRYRKSADSVRQAGAKTGSRVFTRNTDVLHPHTENLSRGSRKKHQPLPAQALGGRPIGSSLRRRHLSEGRRGRRYGQEVWSHNCAKSPTWVDPHTAGLASRGPNVDVSCIRCVTARCCGNIPPTRDLRPPSSVIVAGTYVAVSRVGPGLTSSSHASMPLAR